MAYFSNGTEGEILYDQCHDCPLGYGWKQDAHQKTLLDLGVPEADPKGCPVFMVQMQYNYDQIRSPGCDATAGWLEGLPDDQLPEFVEVDDSNNVKLSYGSTKSQIEQAIRWLRSDSFRSAMNYFIDERGVCQVRKLLVEIRR